MSRIARYSTWVVGVAVMLGAVGRVGAQPGGLRGEEVHAQLFSSIEQPTAAIGEPFFFVAELYASPGSEEAARQVVRAFEAARFVEVPPGLEVVRADGVERQDYGEEAGVPVMRLVRRFVLRAQGRGRVEVPALAVAIGQDRYETAPYTLEVYGVDPLFFAARPSILPVVVEQREREQGRKLVFTRIGSAFLVAPDALVTSLHVVMDADEIRLRLPSGRWVRTRKAWSVDPAQDVAVLYLDPKLVEAEGLTPLELAPMADPVRHWRALGPDDRVVFTNGWPGGLQRSSAGVHFRSLSLQQFAPLWISGNPVRPGDSGGPLLDRYGRAIGVISAGSVLHARRDVLREELCIATDFRPALGRKNLATRPRSLRALLRAPAVADSPHAHALRLSLLLSMRGLRTASAEQALDHLDANLDRSADRAPLHFVRGTIHQAFGRKAAAAADYQAAISASESYFFATYMLALHHLSAREYEVAAHLFRRLQQFAPYTHLAALGLARTSIRRLEYGAAVPHLRAVLRYDPAFPPALFELAYCHLARGEEVRARQLAARLAEVDPGWAGRLRQVLRYPILRPFTLPELPLAALPAAPH